MGKSPGIQDHKGPDEHAFRPVRRGLRGGGVYRPGHLSGGKSSEPRVREACAADLLRPTQWLKTDLGTTNADLDVAQGVSAALDLILGADRKMNGKFYNIRVPGWEEVDGRAYDGAEIPW